jgi:phage terminase large subunit
MAATECVAEFPAKLEFLFQPYRYKVVKGGRYGLKSWNFARALLMICAQPGLLWAGRKDPVRILCARETQKSISESVHQLLEDQIQNLNLSRFYTVTKSAITCGTGGFFSFAGIRQNVNNLKSFEGYDICWVEEAQTVSRNSWNVLIPTIRKEGSEIWVSYNPELETDETHQRFAIHPPTNAKVVHTTWKDNPWVTEVIRQEIADLRARSEDDYLNVYEGMCKQAVEGAIYKQEIGAAEKDGRLTRVPYDPQHPVHTFWDLGFGDNTSIWFVQTIAFEFRIIDHLSASLQALSYYIKALKDRPYVYGKHYLPHDGAAHELGTGKSIEEQLRLHFPASVFITPKLSVADGIAAARAIFSRCWFDRDKCTDGLQSLRHYRYDRDENLNTFKREPLHDWASHDADAFRTFAVAIKEVQRPRPARPPAKAPTAWS